MYGVVPRERSGGQEEGAIGCEREGERIWHEIEAGTSLAGKGCATDMSPGTLQDGRRALAAECGMAHYLYSR